MGMAASKWTEEELQILLENPDLDTTILAEKLGRSNNSVAQKRWKLQKPEHCMTAQFDKRPSGWYEESVGQMLIEFEPAWESWKHYHRYVEIEYAGYRETILGGLVHLRCRRDADAP